MICDVQMRSDVNSRSFLLRKSLDNFLHKLLPRTWVPLYTMVSYKHLFRNMAAQTNKKEMYLSIRIQ